jgi:hypothetical protein
MASARSNSGADQDLGKTLRGRMIQFDGKPGVRQ